MLQLPDGDGGTVSYFDQSMVGISQAKKKNNQTADEIELEQQQALESLQVMLNANRVVPRKMLVKALQVGLSGAHSSGVFHFDKYLSVHADSRGYWDQDAQIIDGLVDAKKEYFDQWSTSRDVANGALDQAKINKGYHKGVLGTISRAAKVLRLPDGIGGTVSYFDESMIDVTQSRKIFYEVNESHPNYVLFREHPPGLNLVHFLRFLDKTYPNEDIALGFGVAALSEGSEFVQSAADPESQVEKSEKWDLAEITGEDISKYETFLTNKKPPLQNATIANYLSAIPTYILKYIPKGKAKKELENNETIDKWQGLRRDERSTEGHPRDVFGLSESGPSGMLGSQAFSAGEIKGKIYITGPFPEQFRSDDDNSDSKDWDPARDLPQVRNIINAYSMHQKTDANGNSFIYATRGADLILKFDEPRNMSSQSTGEMGMSSIVHRGRGVTSGYKKHGPVAPEDESLSESKVTLSLSDEGFDVLSSRVLKIKPSLTGILSWEIRKIGIVQSVGSDNSFRAELSKHPGESEYAPVIFRSTSPKASELDVPKETTGDKIMKVNYAVRPAPDAVASYAQSQEVLLDSLPEIVERRFDAVSRSRTELLESNLPEKHGLMEDDQRDNEPSQKRTRQDGTPQLGGLQLPADPTRAWNAVNRLPSESEISGTIGISTSLPERGRGGRGGARGR
jgi:hypothetical protein